MNRKKNFLPRILAFCLTVALLLALASVSLPLASRGGLPLARRRCCSFSRIVCLADAIAANPNWWRCNRLHVFCPELTHAQIGALLGITKQGARALEVSAIQKLKSPESLRFFEGYN